MYTVYASPDGNSKKNDDVKKWCINEDVNLVNEADIFVLSRINVLHREKIQIFIGVEIVKLLLNLSMSIAIT